MKTALDQPRPVSAQTRDGFYPGSMAGKTVLITGATGGIGKATAMGLAAMGANLALTGRERGRTEAASREVRAVGHGQVDVL